jgi:hypothetical protein
VLFVQPAVLFLLHGRSVAIVPMPLFAMQVFIFTTITVITA